MMRSARSLGVVLLQALAACSKADADLPPTPTSSGSLPPLLASSAAASEASAAAPRDGSPSPRAAEPDAPQTLTLVAGGDVSYGRGVGQALMRDPLRDDLEAVSPWFRDADLRFVNLECPLSDQKGVTQHPTLRLVFNGPPEGADALSRAGIDLVSLANNHAWDYGQKGLFETMENLERKGIAYVGAGREPGRAYRPTLVRRKDLRVAFLAITDIWNQGLLLHHKALPFVARADQGLIAEEVKRAREDMRADIVVVSYHGLAEYLDLPLPRTRAIVRAAIDAGADIVIGHHPHVVQGVEWRAGHPILYSLGNLMMEMSPGRKPPSGFVARIVLSRREQAPSLTGSPPPARAALALEICPIAFAGPRPTRPSAEVAARSLRHVEAISKDVGGTTVGALREDGCARVTCPHGAACEEPKEAP